MTLIRQMRSRRSLKMVKLANITSKEGSQEYAQKLLETLEKLCDILGIITEKEEELLDADIEALIEERQAARKAKNFCTCRRDPKSACGTGHHFKRYQRRGKMDESLITNMKKQLQL